MKRFLPLLILLLILSLTIFESREMVSPLSVEQIKMIEQITASIHLIFTLRFDINPSCGKDCFIRYSPANRPDS